MRIVFAEPPVGLLTQSGVHDELLVIFWLLLDE